MQSSKPKGTTNVFSQKNNKKQNPCLRAASDVPRGLRGGICCRLRTPLGARILFARREVCEGDFIMSTNRILCFLGDAEARRYGRARRQLTRIRSAVEQIETAIGGNDFAEFLVPSLSELAENDGEFELAMLLKVDIIRVSKIEGMAAHFVSELRALSEQLAVTADQIHGGAV